jgi:hypothetical protein
VTWEDGFVGKQNRPLTFPERNRNVRPSEARWANGHASDTARSKGGRNGRTLLPPARLNDFERSPNSAALYDYWHDLMRQYVGYDATEYPAAFDVLQLTAGETPVAAAPGNRLAQDIFFPVQRKRPQGCRNPLIRPKRFGKPPKTTQST